MSDYMFEIYIKFQGIVEKYNLANYFFFNCLYFMGYKLYLN